MTTNEGPEPMTESDWTSIRVRRATADALDRLRIASVSDARPQGESRGLVVERLIRHELDRLTEHHEP